MNHEAIVNVPYGRNINGNAVVVPDGWQIVKENSSLKKGDRPYDIYAGFLGVGFYNEKHTDWAVSKGRWTTWIRKVSL